MANTPVNQYNKTTGKREAIGGGAFIKASTQKQVDTPIVASPNTPATKTIKSTTPKSILPNGMTEDQYNTFYNKQSAADQTKLVAAGYSAPVQPVTNTKPTTKAKVEKPAELTPQEQTARDYQDTGDTRQSQIINNLNTEYANNPNMIANQSEFNKTYNVGNGVRSSVQDQTIQSRYNSKQQEIKANAKTQAKLNTLNTLNGSNLANISSTDATFLMANNPTKYQEYLTAKKTKDGLDTINGVTATTPVDNTEANFIADIMKQLGGGTSVDLTAKRSETKSNAGLDEKAIEMNEKKQTYDDLMTAYNNVQKSVDKRYEGQGVDRGYLTALAQKEQYDMQDAINTAQSAYELATNNYNSALGSAQQDFTVLQAQVAQDNQVFNQKLQGLGFAYDLYKDTPEYQMQQAQIKYNIDNPDMDSTDPVVQKQALNQTLAGYYKDYGMIIQRPQSQVVNDVISYAKANNVSVSEALKENFIKPLQNKSEYKIMTNKALGIETPSYSVSVAADGTRTVTYTGQGDVPANLLNNTSTTNNTGSASWLSNTITNYGTANDAGVDFDVKVGDAIQAPVSGTLTLAKDSKTGNVYAKITQSNGDTVQINHLDASTLANFQSLNGQQITAGQQIGIGGNTGNVKDSSGNWLRKDGVAINPTALASGSGSHLDVRVNSGGKQLIGQDLINYLKSGNNGDLTELAEYLVDTQPRGQGFSNDDVAAYTNAVNKYAKRGDKETVMQLYRNQLLKDKQNATVFDTATNISQRISITQDLMKQYQDSGKNMNIFNGTMQNVANKLGESGDPLLIQIGQNLGMLTADFVKEISGTAASDAEVNRLIQLLPKTTAKFDRNTLLSEGFKQRVVLQAENALKNSMGKNKEMLYEAFPELKGLVNNSTTPQTTPQTTPTVNFGYSSIPTTPSRLQSIFG